MAENLDPNIMYLEWSGSSFPNSSLATFKAPAGSTIDWGDGTVETFDADSTQVNTHTYNDGTDNHLIRISGVTSIGEFAFSGCSNLTSVEIPDSVTSIGNYAFSHCNRLTSVVIGNSVTSIGEYAFRNCNRLTHVVIPDSVTSIGKNAFESCYKLVEVVNKSTHITVEKGSESNGYVGKYALAVYNSGDTFESKLSNDNGYSIYTDGEEKILVGYTGTETDLVLPSYVTKIYQYTFSWCDSLTSVSIGNSVTSIGENAFEYCYGLTSVVIPDSVTSIGNYAFSNCIGLTSVVIGNSVTSIGEMAFERCLLTSVTIPDSVTSIGNGAFCDGRLRSIEVSANNANYQSIDGNLYTKSGKTLIQYATGKTATSFTIPDSVTSIGGSAFRACRSLTSVTILDSVTSIGDYAFSDCRSLTSVVIGNGVTSIGGWAFYNCSSLTSVYITDIEAWCNISFSSSTANPLSYAKNLYLNNELVAELVIPDGVTSIGDDAFRSCSSLTSVVIPDSVTSIGDAAFMYCSNLASVKIPDSVTSIGDRAFAECSRLTSIMVFPITPPKLFSSSIPSTIQSIYVQKSSTEAYKKSSRWSSFADKIVGNTTYLSFVRFNQANKKYIDSKISALESRIAELESKLNG